MYLWAINKKADIIFRFTETIGSSGFYEQSSHSKRFETLTKTSKR